MVNITVTAPAGSADWQRVVHQYLKLNSSHVIKFSTTQTEWGVVVNPDGVTHWLVGLSDLGVPFITKYNGSFYAQVAGRNTTYTGAMDVIVQFSEIRFGSMNDLWRTAAMWVNGVHVINYVEPAAHALADTLSFGFAVHYGVPITFSNVVVPQLGDQAEVATMDTGETPAGGLQRTIEGRYLKYLIRPNGSLYAWRPIPVGESTVLLEDEGMSENTYTNQIRTHIRMVGAYDYAEYADDSLIKDYGYTFMEDNNPYLMTESDCYFEARQNIRRLLEGSISGSVANTAIHFIQIEDGIGVRGNSRIINGLTLSYRGPDVAHAIDYRGDFWLTNSYL